MSRYFSKLAIRTGITKNLGDRSHQQPGPMIKRTAQQQNIPVPSQRGLEVRMGKTADSAISEKSAMNESRIQPDEVPAHVLPSAEQGDSISNSKGSAASDLPQISHDLPARPIAEKNEATSSPAVSPEILQESTAQTTLPQNISPMENEQRYPDGRIEQSQPLKVSTSAGVETGNETTERIQTIDRQFVRVLGSETTAQQSFSEVGMAEGSGRSIPEQATTTEETVAEARILPISNTDKEIQVHGNGFTDGLASIMETQKAVSSSEKLAGPLEATQPDGQTKIIQVVTQSQTVPDGHNKQARPRLKKNLVDVHIGTISFEVHQAPSVPAPLPQPAMVSKSQRPPMPRLSRYYLRGW